jgi:hypothetical protein
MEIGSPQDWAQGVGAFKNAVDAISSVLQLVKQFGAGGKKPTTQEQELIDRALAEADKAAKVADAQTLKALGYTLCHCEFPPPAMFTVGHHQAREREGPVYECPRCGYNTADPWMYTRLAPPRAAAPPEPASNLDRK